LSLQGRHEYDLVVEIDEVENEMIRKLEVWFSSLIKLTILIPNIDCFRKENWVSIFKHLDYFVYPIDKSYNPKLNYYRTRFS
jgi:hypothetical protein